MKNITQAGKICLLAALPFLSCKKPVNTDPEDHSHRGILHQTVNANFAFGQAETVNLDMNNDGSPDFGFYSQIFQTDIDRLEGFLVKSYGAAQVLQLELTGNPVFESMNVWSFTDLEQIPATPDVTRRWTPGNGMLAIRHVSEQVNYIGRWSDGNVKIMAVCLRVSGKVHYGWIRLRYSRERNEMTLLDCGFNQTAGASVKAGEID